MSVSCSTWAIALHLVLAIHADAVLISRQLHVAAEASPVKLNEEALSRHMLEELELYSGRENQSWADQSAAQDAVTAFCTLAFAATAAKEGLPWQYVQFKTQFTSLAKAELKLELQRHRGSSSGEEKGVRLRSLAKRLGRAFVEAVQGDMKRVAKRRALEVRDEAPAALLPTLAFRRQRGRSPRRSAGPVDAFTVRTGSCQKDERGCILSPGYPGNYSNRQSCVIGLNTSSPIGPLVQESFDTERSYDVFIVNGVKYSGANGPDSVVPSTDMLWYTDYNNTGMGWKLCPGGQEGVWMAPVATAPVQPFSVIEGDCAVDAEGCATSPNYPADYPMDDGCTIAVSESIATPLVVTNFSTEFSFDSLTVNGQSFSGLDGPHGLTPRGNITWATDSSSSSSGWRICSSSTGGQHGANSTGVLRVRAGPCSVDAEGCATSAGFFRDGKSRYHNGEMCIIQVNASEARPLRVTAFSTEVGYDNLIVNGIRYSGLRGPIGVVPFEDIVWLADDSTVSSGWRICLGPDLNDVAPDADVPGAVADVFTVRAGNCTATDSNGCISSPNFPREYGPQESCIIDVANKKLMPLRVDEFSTEQDADVLTINGQAFSGVTGPDGVVPTGQIDWSSDTNISAGGWKLCLVPLPPGESQPQVQEGLPPPPPDNPHDDWSLLGEIKKAMVVVSGAWRATEAKADAFEEAGQGFKEDLMAALDNKSIPLDATVRSVEAIVRSGLHEVLGNWTSVAQRVESALKSSRQEMLTVDPSGLVVPLLKWTEGTELRAIDTYVRWLRDHTFWVHAVQIDWALVTATQVRWLQESADSLLEHMDNFQEHLYGLMEEVVGSMQRKLSSMEERVMNQAVQQSLQLLNVTALGCAAGLDVMDKAASQASGHSIKEVVQSVVEFLCNERKEAAVEAVVPIEKEMLLITIGEAIAQGQEALAAVTATAWQLHRAAWAVHSAIFGIESRLHEHLRPLATPSGL